MNVKDLTNAKSYLSKRFLRNMKRFGSTDDACWTGSSADLTRVLRSNVHGVGLGHKIVAGKETTEVVVQVFVNKKLPVSLVSSRYRVPETVDGLPTDVIEDDFPCFLAARRTSSNTTTKGDSVVVGAGLASSHYKVTSGTIGYLVRSKDPSDDPNEVFAIGNNHVFADTNRAKIGDRIVHPGGAHAAGKKTRIGKLWRFVPITSDAHATNYVDAALIKIDSNVSTTREVPGGGDVKGVTSVSRRRPVTIYGAANGKRTGMVFTTNYDHVLPYKVGNDTVWAQFSNQFRIKASRNNIPVASPGDSGALVLCNKTNKAMGMVYAASAHGVFAFASPIDVVCTELKVELL